MSDASVGVLLALLGANGAGKSTLIKMLAGVVRETAAESRTAVGSSTNRVAGRANHRDTLAAKAAEHKGDRLP